MQPPQGTEPPDAAATSGGAPNLLMGGWEDYYFLARLYTFRALHRDNTSQQRYQALITAQTNINKARNSFTQITYLNQFQRWMHSQLQVTPPQQKDLEALAGEIETWLTIRSNMENVERSLDQMALYRLVGLKTFADQPIPVTRQPLQLRSVITAQNIWQKELAANSTQLKPLQKWWDRLRDEFGHAIATLMQKPEIEQEYNLELRIFRFVLDNTPDPDKQQSIEGELRRQLEDIQNRLTLDMNQYTSGKTIPEVFKEQEAKFAQIDSKLDTFVEFAVFMQKPHQQHSTAEWSPIAEQARTARTEATKKRNLLGRLKQSYNDIVISINNVCKPSRNFEVAEAKLQQLEQQFVQHPAIADLRGRIDEAKATLEVLRGYFKRMQSGLESEEYSKLQNILEDIDAEDRSAAEQFHMFEDDENELRDPLTQPPSRIKDWETLAKIAKRDDEYILNFVREYEHYRTEFVRTERPEHIGLITNKPKKISDEHHWHQDKNNPQPQYPPQTVEKALSRGDFEEVKRLLDVVSQHVTSRLQGAQKPPLPSGQAQGANSPQDAYTDAIEQAPTARGREQLKRMRDEALPFWSERNSAIDRAKAEAKSREESWQNGQKAWEEAINRIRRFIPNGPPTTYKRLQNRAERNELRDFVKKAYRAFEQCRMACGEHPQLQKMIDLRNADAKYHGQGAWVFRAGMQLCGYKTTHELSTELGEERT